MNPRRDNTRQIVASDGTPVKIINIIDDHSRVAVASRAAPTADTAAFLDAVCDGADQWGWPARILTDNARALKRLATHVAELGVGSGHSRPYHPQTCGKVERFHHTLKQFLTAQPDAHTITELQPLLDRFTDHYNHHRPHRSLDRHTPATIHATHPPTGPAHPPHDTPTRIHRVTVTGGSCYINRDYAITVGATHNGTTATVIITNQRCHIFIAGTLVRALTLDPTRRHQPLYDRPGRPTPP
ncbi:MAG: integrase core domain-containing protein [Acidimicrobiia bacterium]|nr:integrase core domain-containing protein [Acidimicrobiia bacterium]